MLLPPLDMCDGNCSGGRGLQLTSAAASWYDLPKHAQTCCRERNSFMLSCAEETLTLAKRHFCPVPGLPGDSLLGTRMVNSLQYV